MKTITIEAFTLDELSEDAKQKAHESFLEDPFLYDITTNDYRSSLDEFCKLFPVVWSSFDEYNMDFSIREDDDILNISGSRLLSYIWNNFKDDIWKPGYLKTYSTQKTGPFICKHKKDYKGRTYSQLYSRIKREYCAPLTGCYIDDSLLSPIVRLWQKPVSNSYTYRELLEDCMNSFVDSLRNEYEWTRSFEYFQDESAINERYYTKQGELI